MKRLDAKTKAILGNLSYQMTVTIRATDLKDVRFYRHSSKTIFVQLVNTLLPEAGYSDKRGAENMAKLQAAGFVDTHDVAAWLEANGAKAIKKPRAYKSRPSFYD